MTEAFLLQARKTGWLLTESKTLKNWKKRYCVLKNGALFYYLEEKSVKPEGIVVLRGAKVIFFLSQMNIVSPINIHSSDRGSLHQVGQPKKPRRGKAAFRISAADSYLAKNRSHLIFAAASKEVRSLPSRSPAPSLAPLQLLPLSAFSFVALCG